MALVSTSEPLRELKEHQTEHQAEHPAEPSAAIFDLASFLPAYPHVEKQSDNLFELFPSSFEQSLYQKREFFDLQPDKFKAVKYPGSDFKPQSQQIYHWRYSDFRTPNDRQLIIHSMGLGKTSLAIGEAEFNLGRSFKRALVIQHNDKLRAGFIDEIFKVTGDKYLPKDFEATFGRGIRNRSAEEETKIRNLKRKHISPFYEFTTYEKFAKEIRAAHRIQGRAWETLVAKYSNCIIIMDEVQNMRVSGDTKKTTKSKKSAGGSKPGEEKGDAPLVKASGKGQPRGRQRGLVVDSINSKEIYTMYHIFLHTLENCKVVILSATPMADKWNEISDVLNLILTNEQQLPTGAAFDKQGAFFNDGVTIEHEDLLRQRLKGLISFLRTPPSLVPRDYVGVKVGGLAVFNVVQCPMSAFQNEKYLEAYRFDKSKGDAKAEDAKVERGIGALVTIGPKSTKRAAIYSKSRNAINFVFPNGKYGTSEFKSKSNEPPGLPPDLSRALREGTGGTDFESMEFRHKVIENLRRFSAKFAFSLEKILEQRDNASGASFVFNIFVNGGGCFLFARILEMFGYRMLDADDEIRDEAPRFALLTGTTMTQAKIRNVLKTLNRPDNYTGRFLQVIIGSSVTGEGFSFHHIENIFVQSAFWNYTLIDQAVFRGFRYDSHIESLKHNPAFRIKIYHLASVPSTGPEESIDIVMYKISEDKDRKIKRGERLLKEVSYDCATNRTVNMRGSGIFDGTRECEYQSCNYKCEGIENFQVNHLDVISYNNFHSGFEQEEIIAKLRTILQAHPEGISFEALVAELRCSEFVLLLTLKRVIDESVVFYTRYGFKSYVREFRNRYFLSDTVELPKDDYGAWYSSHPVFCRESEFESTLENFQTFTDLEVIAKIETMISGMVDDSKRMNSYWTQLSQSAKEQFIEGTLDLESQIQGNPVLNWIYTTNRASIRRNTGLVIFTLDRKNWRCKRITGTGIAPEGAWYSCTDKSVEVKAVQTVEADLRVRMLDNPTGFYGIRNPKDMTKFRLVDRDEFNFKLEEAIRIAMTTGSADAKKLISGKACYSFTEQALAFKMFKMGLDYPSVYFDSMMGGRDWGASHAAKVNQMGYQDVIRRLADDRILQKELKDIYGITVDSLNLTDSEAKRFYRLMYPAVGVSKKHVCNIIVSFLEAQPPFENQSLMMPTDEEDGKAKWAAEHFRNLLKQRGWTGRR